MRYFQGIIDEHVTQGCQLPCKRHFVGSVLRIEAQVFQEDDLARLDFQNGSRHAPPNGIMELPHTQSESVGEFLGKIQFQFCRALAAWPSHMCGDDELSGFANQ